MSSLAFSELPSNPYTGTILFILIRIVFCGGTEYRLPVRQRKGKGKNKK